MNRTWVWLAAFCWILAAVAALVPFAGVRVAGGTATGAALAAGASLFLIPFAWHLAAERHRKDGREGRGLRLSLRALAVALVLLAGSLAAAGAGGTWLVVRNGVPWPHRERVKPPPVLPGASNLAAGQARVALEALVPGDATLVVSSAGRAALQELLARGFGAAETSVAALDKCGVRTAEVAWAFALRDSDRLFATRLPGAEEDRTLYCVAGVLGAAGVHVTVTPEVLTIAGLTAGPPVRARRLDRQTLLVVDEPWRGVVDARTAGQGASLFEGRLSAAADRIDRKADLWAVARIASDSTSWLLALDAKPSADRWQLRASATAPDQGRADATLTAPAALAAALPVSVRAALLGLLVPHAAPAAAETVRDAGVGGAR